jgi:hypothetical protein
MTARRTAASHDFAASGSMTNDKMSLVMAWREAPSSMPHSGKVISKASHSSS